MESNKSSCPYHTKVDYVAQNFNLRVLGSDVCERKCSKANMIFVETFVKISFY